MLSYEKRLQSFKDWPKEYERVTKKLSVIGHHSTDTETRTTKCLYCEKEHRYWNDDDNPFIEHYKEVGTDCILYKLQFPKCRRGLAKGIVMNEEKEELIANKYMYINIDDHDILLCMICGSTDKTHQCNNSKKKMIQKMNENIDIETAHFFIKYLSGCFIDEIDSYLSNKARLNKEQKAMLNCLLNENKPNNCFVTLDSFIEQCSDKIYHDLEKKMKNIESSAIENIYNESMIL